MPTLLAIFFGCATLGCAYMSTVASLGVGVVWWVLGAFCAFLTFASVLASLENSSGD